MQIRDKATKKKISTSSTSKQHNLHTILTAIPRGGGGRPDQLRPNASNAQHLKTNNEPHPQSRHDQQRLHHHHTSSSEYTKQDNKDPPPPPPPLPSQDLPKDDPRILFLIRLLFITYYGSLGSLLPYLPVYYHSLGHGGQIIGMLGAIKPFTTFLVAPGWGIVSDRTGNPFLILYFTFLVSLIAQLLVAVRHDPKYIMAMVFITALFNAPVKSLMDSMVMETLNDRSQYGRLRLWGQLGFGLGSSGVGVLLSRSKHKAYHYHEGHSFMEKLDTFWQSLTGYKLLFLTYAILSVPTWFCMRAFHELTNRKNRQQQQQQEAQLDKHESSRSKDKIQPNDPQVGLLEGVRILFQNADAVLFFFLVFVVGISSGVIENFAYVRIREVGGTGKDMGLSRLVSSLSGAPMFWFSGPLTELLGADRVIVLSLLSYVLRFLIYALMRNPLQGLPAEAMRGITFAAFWSTGTIYASRIAPPGMGATMVSDWLEQ
jgi:MFS family permease